MAFVFSKYRDSGPLHWREMTSRSLMTFNAHQQARYDLALGALGNIRDKKVVDLGSGDGSFTSMLVRTGANVTGIDNEPIGIALSKELFAKHHLSADFINGSVEKMPLPDHFADAVVSCDVIEHLDDPARHVAEAFRILKPGGVLVITTPYRICETPAPFHIHEFYPSELKALAEPFASHVEIWETHHMFWNAFFNYRPKILRRFHLGRVFINMMTLWLGCNPFLEDADNRKKRDYYTQITLKAVKRS